MEEISAGGVVFRRNDDAIQIQLVQDRYGKIALPKGKMELGETIEQTALREIEEETGIVGSIIVPLEDVKYHYKSPVNGSVNKVVHYFLVEEIGGSLKPQMEEIRGVEWLSPEEAWEKQLHAGYDNNDSVMRKALDHLGLV